MNKQREKSISNIGFKISKSYYDASNTPAFSVSNKEEFKITVFTESENDIPFWKAILSQKTKKYRNISLQFIPISSIFSNHKSADGCHRLYSLLLKEEISLTKTVIACVDSDHCCYEENEHTPFENWCKERNKSIPKNLKNINEYIFPTIAYSIENIQYDLNIIKKLHYIEPKEADLIKEYFSFLETTKNYLTKYDIDEYYKWLNKSTSWLKHRSFKKLPQNTANPTQIKNKSNLKITHLIRGHNFSCIVNKFLKELKSQQCSQYIKTHQSVTNTLNKEINPTLPKNPLENITNDLNIILGSCYDLHPTLPIYKTIQKFDNFCKKLIHPALSV